ncbi:carbon-nitrogen hydrolase family protein [Nocardioides sp.]|uniref:carbon-nitrogen hydrolase family protein n=1 Tax=Nocardioides sp. TaxID=35761 RepID=UPI0010A3D985|nr:carbon-nitrogen hydrolase family protein [Nocardioides sp.]THJ08678.1 carbon-nitrogen hydrolase family protein [Nocardioides sp.]
MPPPLTVAVAQTTPVPADVEANVRDHARTVQRAGASGARLCVFPELSLTGYELAAIAKAPGLMAVTSDDGRLDPIRDACSATGVTALVGAPLRTPKGLQLATLVIGPTGDHGDSYGKMHLHGAERDIFVPGREHRILELDGWRLGLAVCYDAAVPEHADEVHAAGADAYVVSALYCAGEEHRLAEQTSRAAALGMWVVLAQFVGTTGPFQAIGRSGVWQPGGATASQLTDSLPGLAIVRLAR